LASFYDDWLVRSAANHRSVSDPPVVAHGSELRWTETPQDARAAVLIGEASGFPTQGTALLRAEIPVGWHTGGHVHGEEAIFVLAGSGFIVIDGRRYDFRPGTAIHVPYMSDHQLVNTADEPVSYLSAVTTDLDLFARLGRLEQRSEKGEGNRELVAQHPAEASQFGADGRRITLHPEERLDESILHAAGHDRHRPGHQPHRHGAVWILMGGSEDGGTETNGFQAKAAAMTHVFEEVPHSSSHKHSHTEAMLYVLEGSGYSEVDGKRYDWAAGDAVHVPPKMTVHEHFNNSDQRTQTLRVEFGIRFFYEALWNGYQKVEIRPTAIAR
jgi:quercetin dioxygenase-like cupin family protein